MTEWNARVHYPNTSISLLITEADLQPFKNWVTGYEPSLPTWNGTTTYNRAVQVRRDLITHVEYTKVAKGGPFA